MAKLRAGTLRHKIIIQRKTETKGAAGAIVNTWNNIKITRASINPITGKEWFINESIVNEVDQYLMLRKTDLTPADRIIYKSRIFNIVRVLNVAERGNKFIVLAKERIGEIFGTTVENILLEDGADLLTEAAENLTTE